MNVSVRVLRTRNSPIFFVTAKFAILKSFSLLSWCRLSFPVIGLKIFSLPTFLLKSCFKIVYGTWGNYRKPTLIPIKTVFWIITFLLIQCMHIQNSDITPVTTQNYIWHPITNKPYSVWYAEWNETHSTLHTRRSSTQNNKYKVSHRYSCFSWWWAHIRPKHIEIDKSTKNKLCPKLVLLKNIQLFVFSAHPDGSSSQLIRIIGVLLYLKSAIELVGPNMAERGKHFILSVVDLPSTYYSGLNLLL